MIRILDRLLRPKSNIHADNWDFLKELQAFQVPADQGKEILVADFNSDLTHAIRKYSSQGHFTCKLDLYPYILERWVTLASNKFGAPISGLYVPNDNEGFVLILPQLSEKAQLVFELVHNVFPAITPHLYPYTERQTWVHRAEYELPEVLLLQEEISQVEAETKRRIESLEEQIRIQRQSQGYWHQLISGTGEPLVEAVQQAFSFLGFERVIDIDKAGAIAGKTAIKREDLQIHDHSPLILVEIKGIANLPKEAAALQVWKYIAPRMKELHRTDIRGLAIINHQRHIPPLDRDNSNTFSDDLITNAEEQDFGLMTCWDLYKLVRNTKRGVVLVKTS